MPSPSTPSLRAFANGHTTYVIIAPAARTPVCAGLAAAHAAGVLHRDLKPENVILARDGRAVITDFGIAHAATPELGGGPGGIVGTPAYMAPEQLAGVVDLDPRADLYALGAMLFTLLAGTPPFEGESFAAIIASRASRVTPDVRGRVAEVPDAVAAVVSSTGSAIAPSSPPSARAPRRARSASYERSRERTPGGSATRAASTISGNVCPSWRATSTSSSTAGAW